MNKRGFGLIGLLMVVAIIAIGFLLLSKNLNKVQGTIIQTNGTEKTNVLDLARDTVKKVEQRSNPIDR